MQEQNIIAYLKGKATKDEEKKIENWIMASGENARKFNLLKAEHIASTFDETSKAIDIGEGYSAFVRTTSSCTNNRMWIPILKCAAMVVVILGIGYFYMRGSLNEIKITTIPDDAITLKLDNGNIKIITEDGKTSIVDAKGNLVGSQEGTQLVYKKGALVEKLVYNTLTVPYGKRFDVILSDGTHVFLNSGSSFKYPIKFIKGKYRQVFLEGEAFFDVVKDTDHPFIVNTDALNVRVLGTKFNVSSYPEDQLINTTLVEGSVTIHENKEAYDGTRSLVLKPGYNAEWNKDKESITVNEADVSLYISWINGKVVFRHMPFKNIIKKLERHYNVSIANQNKKLDNELFTASFDIETIDQVFNTFRESYGMEYTITDNKIIIK